jgi:hypothetical protein
MKNANRASAIWAAVIMFSLGASKLASSEPASSCPGATQHCVRNSRLVLSAVATVPIFDEFTTVGPGIGGVWLPSSGSKIWQSVLAADLSLFAIDGARRMRSSLQAGARFWPFAGTGAFVQSTVGAAGYVERVRSDLGLRMLDSTSTGGGIVGELGIGWAVAWLDLSAGWQQNLLSTPGIAFGSVIVRIGGLL